MSLPADVEVVGVFDLPMRFRFRAVDRRQGVILSGPAGLAEWSPFADYAGAVLAPWRAAAIEAATLGFPPQVRDEVPVNVTIGAVSPADAHARVVASGCSTAKVKVAEPGRPPAEDEARLEAVRDALGPSGRLRIDANGAWGRDEALARLRVLARHDLEYVEQPCPDVADLAWLRRALLRAGVYAPIAADESIRLAADPLLVARAEAADVAVLKVQPLGGVRAALRLADRLGLPAVVSSAIETSIGLDAGLALAGALPELPFACGLNTADMLVRDVVARPLRAEGGVARRTPIELDPDALGAAEEVERAWLRRWDSG